MRGDLGGAAHGTARANGPRGKPFDRGSRQPVGEIGGKGGGKDDAVGYDAGKKVKRPQDPRRGRHRRTADAGRCPLRRHSGPRRAELVLEKYTGAFPGSN